MRSKDEIEPANAQILSRKIRAERHGQTVEHMLEIVELTDGFGKDQTARGRFLRHHRIQRLEHVTMSLIETQAHLSAEPTRHRRTRHGGKLADAVDPQAVQAFDDLMRQTQCRDRKIGNRRHALPRRHDAPIAVSRHGPGRTGRIRHARPRVNVLRGKPPKQIGHELFLAAEKSRRARDIDPDSIRRARRHDRRIADAPARQFDQGRLVLIRHRFDDMEIGHQRLTLCHRLADSQTERVGLVVDGADQPPGPFGFDRHQWLIRQRRAAMAPDPVGRPGRQVERDDPSHHRPRESRNGVRRRGSAEDPPASGHGPGPAPAAHGR